jgi:hypothetical protein
MNDVLVDALWELAEREGITRDQIAKNFPVVSGTDPINNKVTEMPKAAKKK